MDCQKVSKSDLQIQFSTFKIIQVFLILFLFNDTRFGAGFYYCHFSIASIFKTLKIPHLRSCCATMIWPKIMPNVSAFSYSAAGDAWGHSTTTWTKFYPILTPYPP